MDSNSSPIKNRALRYVSSYVATIVVIAAFTGGVIIGRGQNSENVTKAQSTGGSVAVNINRAVQPVSTVDFNQFWKVWDEVKQKYVHQPVKDSDLFYGAIQGMVAAVGDPYTTYLPPKEATEFSQGLSGELEGIGAEVGLDKNSQLIVISPLSGAPAEKIGLKPQDKILLIDKESTLGMDLETAVSKIRGPGGTTVVLTVNRTGFTKPQEFKIVRAKINIPSIKLTWKPGGIAYLQISQFNDQLLLKLDSTINEIKKQKAKGIILDLRNNPGGYLEAAVDVASEWIADGAIVSERGLNGLSQNHPTTGAHRLKGIKTIVLVNRGSASASEIVAGALQDYGAAQIVGETTFGKGSVQGLENFSDGSALKITVAEWYTPHGKNINKEGVVPNVVIKLDPEKEKPGVDTVLNKALELMKKK